MAGNKTDAVEHPKAAAVRKAAGALADAIEKARSAGFVVDYPSRVDGLASIVISETGRVTGEEPADDLTGTTVETKTVETKPAA